MNNSAPKKCGLNSVIGDNVFFGENVVIGHHCIIEDNVHIGHNSYIDSGCIIRRDVSIGDGSFVESQCIIGEYLMDYCLDRRFHSHPLYIGKNALIRSGSIIYAGSIIGDNFQTGHRVTIREKAEIHNHVSIGSLSDIQGNCVIGNYSRLHSNVHIGQLSKIDDFVWIFPYVVLTNDPTPPSENFVGVHVHPFAIIATGAVIMPGIDIGQDALVAANAMVSTSVPNYKIALGNPARIIADVRNTKNKITGEPAYPWRYHFKSYMPWEKNDFRSWFNSLTNKEKEFYHLDLFEE